MRIALRTLLKSPGFTLIALFTMALGIGVNTSMYTLVDTLLFRSAPFPDPARLLLIQGTTVQAQPDGFAFAEIDEMRAQAAGSLSRPFQTITAFSGWNNALAEPGQPAERLFAVDATADFFTTFGVQPMLGRTYTAEEAVPGRNQVAVLSHAFWQTRFGGDPKIIGRSIRLNAEQVTIIGVMPPSFTYPLFWGKVDLWRPITIPRHIVEDRNRSFCHKFFQVSFPRIEARETCPRELPAPQRSASPPPPHAGQFWQQIYGPGRARKSLGRRKLQPPRSCRG